MLDLYLDIVKALMERGPLSIREIALILKVNSSLVKKRLVFLVGQGMAEEKGGCSDVNYSIAERGVEVLKFFNVPILVGASVDKY